MEPSTRSIMEATPLLETTTRRRRPRARAGVVAGLVAGGCLLAAAAVAVRSRRSSSSSSASASAAASSVSLSTLAAPPTAADAMRDRAAVDHYVCSLREAAMLSGRDVVAYHSLGAGDASVRGAARHAHVDAAGYLWHFASDANRAAFAADPARYAPAWGAFCSWGISTEFAADGWRWAADNLGPPVDPDVFATVGGRLFFFLNADVRDQFAASPDDRVTAGDARWDAWFRGNGTAAEDNTTELRNTMCFRCGDAGLARSCD